MPLWLITIILSAVSLGFYDICKKQSVNGNALFPVLFFATLSGSTVFVITTWLTCPQALDCTPTEFFLILLKSAIVAASWIFGYWGLQLLPITIVGPARSTAPLWTLLGSLLIYSEYPNFWQAIGMFTIFFGYYFLSKAGNQEGFSWHCKGMLVILTATWIGSASALYDKYLLGQFNMDRTTMQFYFSIDLVLFLGLAAVIARRWQKEKFQWRWTIPATGILLILADWLYFYALSTPDARISILSLMRRCNCLITFGVGAWLFHDRNVKQKAWCLAIILAGTIILALASI